MRPVSGLPLNRIAEVEEGMLRATGRRMLLGRRCEVPTRTDLA